MFDSPTPHLLRPLVAAPDLATDLRLSLAFSRVTIRALASLSAEAAATVTEVLDQETDAAERLGAPIEMLDALADLRADLDRDESDSLEAQRLQDALVSAAHALSLASVGGGEPGLHAAKSR